MNSEKVADTLKVHMEMIIESRKVGIGLMMELLVCGGWKENARVREYESNDTNSN